ncbi:NAD(P)H-dependent oxidoreductase [Ligilactobacillus murinus]|uniref:Uncharacterized protein n=1 Tax=Ligilactobacillus murinus TaxID=1622 RepID=A0AAE7BPB7_9LACO|nr:NAD(P)H-dependent oxidoreductase [Ligilactobacillus murinus]MDO4457951.1 NAD(P)H-dependent oxidoreductase [Ligilactobacillus murinus]NEF83575.1 hypothetical protein [Ligilactobacillus murinus]NEF85801.1 hypothetical protein [Ligilactobacillus murinus]NEF88137.1 hypothetical protein [Ligilactobacillus murinus]NEF90425.1 hypothetical protein [Ligilactobacillus murinus]
MKKFSFFTRLEATLQTISSARINDNSPALLKQWLDDVLEFGWAYDVGGDANSG